MGLGRAEGMGLAGQRGLPEWLEEKDRAWLEEKWLEEKWEPTEEYLGKWKASKEQIRKWKEERQDIKEETWQQVCSDITREQFEHNWAHTEKVKEAKERPCTQS